MEYLLMNDQQEPKYDVVWPISKRAVKKTRAANRKPDLNGKVIIELWDVIFRGEIIYPLVREYIKKRFPNVHFVPYTEIGNFHGAREREVTATIADKLKYFKADAAIVGIGA
jgi:hypothetical protein